MVAELNSLGIDRVLCDAWKLSIRVDSFSDGNILLDGSISERGFVLLIDLLF